MFTSKLRSAQLQARSSHASALDLRRVATHSTSQAVKHVPSGINAPAACNNLAAAPRVGSSAHQTRVAVVPRAAAVAAEPEVLRSTRHDAGLHVHVVKVEGRYEITLKADPVRPLILHWAIQGWTAPPQNIWPPNTRQEGDKACQTPFDSSGTVRIVCPEAVCPQAIVFVLKETQPEAWINDGGTDFLVQLKPPGLSNVAQKIMDAEGTYSHWSLFQRFCLAIELLDAADAAGDDGMALLFTWLRLSSMRQLDWYRKSNYQSKDIAHVQKTLAERITEKARSCKTPLSRAYARMALEGLPRGGGNGDDIRMGILHVMRDNGIKEGHRPGIDEKFLEQWHQKLHTNTTPDDVAICEAYLAYLHSNNHDDYWRVLWENGRLTKQDLENFSKPITAWPMHLPHLINPMKHYLWLLKVTHSGANLDTAAEMAKGQMDGDLSWNVFDILANRNEWWVPGKIVEVRSRLASYWKAPGAGRDLLLLDVALEGWFRMQVERVDKNALQGDDLLELVGLVLRNALVGVDGETELEQVVEQWDWIRAGGPGAKWSKEWALAALAATQRAQLSLAAHMDTIYGQVQPHAEAFQAACKLDPKYITNFGEEVVRGRPLFVASPLLQHLEPMLRATAGVSSWQIVSQGAIAPAGQALVIASLADVQGTSYAQPTVLIAEQMGGNEDIPLGVVAVLTRSATDVLSHAAIRARAQRVLLATCFDEAAWNAIRDVAGAPLVTLTVAPEGDVRAVAGTAPVTAHANGANGAPAGSRRLAAPAGTSKWALQEPEFGPGLVGAKALNCAALARAPGKPDWLKAPASVALPWGAFERALTQPANAQVATIVRNGSTRVAEAAAAGGSDLTEALKILAVIRAEVANNLVASDEMAVEIATTAAAAGLIPSAATWGKDTPGWRAAWLAICKVWASKWNDRAWLGRRAAGVPETDLVMGVLLQQVVPADYAYVLHTAHPVTGAPGQLWGEVVAGMGEALVGNYPGRALSFSAPLDASTGGPHLLSLPAKRVALRAPASSPSAPLIIARSDANGEDLEDLAGAGLYDSVPCAPLEESPVAYTREPLVTDAGMRNDLLGRLVDVGRSVRDAFGGVEQDIEGVVSNGEIWVVQSRPQVIHK